MSSRKQKRARIRGELIKGRTVTCASCNLSLKIGFKKNKPCPICGNILPKPEMEKLKLIEKWRIKTLKEKITFITIVVFIMFLLFIVAFEIWLSTVW